LDLRISLAGLEVQVEELGEEETTMFFERSGSHIMTKVLLDHDGYLALLNELGFPRGGFGKFKDDLSDVHGSVEILVEDAFECADRFLQVAISWELVEQFPDLACEGRVLLE
jgi:hypothetical protein